MKKTIILLFLLSNIIVSAQQILKGKITNELNEPVAFSTVKVKNESIGTKTDLTGLYKLNFSVAGTYILEISNLNYEKQTIEVKIEENQTVERNIVLVSSNKKVKNVVVKGAKSKETEQSTLVEQKAATVIKESMGAQEMSRKGASNAQSAILKMVGVSKEEGSSQIYVRGLGDRYNTTTLNGMFLPSDNPEFKNISLEYFPSEVIQSIGISKTYNNTLLGDFGGASIDIATKEYFGKPFLQLGLKAGLNSQAISNKNYGSGVGYFGTYQNSEYPTNIEGKFIERDWQPQERAMPKVNTELQLNGGWSKTFKNNMKLSLFGTLSNSNKFQYFNGLSKVIYATGGDRDNFNKTSYVYTVNQNVMLNTTLIASDKFKTKLNFLGFRTAGNQVNEYIGYNNGINDSIFRRRMINDISSLYVIQSINEYKASNRLNFNINGAVNIIENDQPNRLTTSLLIKDGLYRFLANNSGDHSSYYQNLKDNDYSLNLMGKYKILVDSAENIDKLNINLGYTYRFKDREFRQLDYIYRPTSVLSNGINPNNIDNAYSQSNFDNGLFTMEDENPKNGKIDNNYYLGNLTVHSPSIGVDFLPSKKIALNFGARVDIIDQNVNWNIVSTYPHIGNVAYTDFKVLPFVNAKHIISDRENVKMAFSKTYTLPQFKELAPFLYYDISTYNTRGNPYLYASDNYNLDLKYEWFPSKSELFSLGGFGKFIQNPINKVFEASAGADQMIFVNSGEQAIVLGVELELKKKIFDFTEKTDSLSTKHALTGGMNISALYSHQDLNKDKILKENKGYTSAVFTNTSAGIQGASPLILNFDLTYRIKFPKYEPQASLVFNYFVDRLYALGAQGAGDVYERGVPSLDLITKHKLNDKINFNLNFKNILNPKIERYQEVKDKDNVVISSFTRGVDFSLGFNYNF